VPGYPWRVPWVLGKRMCPLPWQTRPRGWDAWGRPARVKSQSRKRTREHSKAIRADHLDGGLGSRKFPGVSVSGSLRSLHAFLAFRARREPSGLSKPLPKRGLVRVSSSASACASVQGRLLRVHSSTKHIHVHAKDMSKPLSLCIFHEKYRFDANFHGFFAKF